MNNPSTQLRALEEEIVVLKATGVPLPYTETLITIAKELEAELDVSQLVEASQKACIMGLENENATIKRRLDEAMKELEPEPERYYELYSPLIGCVVGVTTEEGRNDADVHHELRPITKEQYEAFIDGTP